MELLACLFDSNSYCDRHTNHGVVTCADQAHHLNALVTLFERAEPIIEHRTENFIDQAIFYLRKAIKQINTPCVKFMVDCLDVLSTTCSCLSNNFYHDGQFSRYYS